MKPSSPGPDAAALARCPLLQGLAPGTAADLLARGGRCRTVPPRGVIFDRGGAGESLFLLLPQAAGVPRPGIVALRAGDSASGKPVSAGFVREGDLFGEIETLRRLADGQPQRRALEARAVTRVRVAELPWALVRGLVTQQPQLQVRLAGHLAERAAFLAAALHAASKDALDTRLARLLLELLPLLGPRQQGTRAGQATTQSDLADALGARREAVSLKLAQWRRAGILDVAAGQGVAVHDPARLARIAAKRGLAGQDSRVVRAALDAGCAFRARNLALDVLPRGDGALGLQHLAVLACARAGAQEEALLLLRRFGFSHGGDVPGLARRLNLAVRDPDSALLDDIAALEPRLAKDAALTMPQGEARLVTLHRVGAAYGQVFAATGGAYPGINAASLFAMGGDPARATATARQVLERLSERPGGYYDHVTRAEAELLLGRAAAAAAALHEATATPDATAGARSTTRRQLRHLAAVLGADWAPLDAALPQRPVVAFVGAPARGTDAAALRRIEEAARECASALRAGSAYGSLRAGAELMLAEAMLDAGAELNAVLPAPAAAFVDAAVRPADRPPSRLERPWVARFDACLARAASVAVAGSAPDAQARRHAARQAMGLALLEADMTEAPCRLVTLGGDGGVEEAVEAWQALGLPLTQVALPWQDAAPSETGEPWRAVVLVSPRSAADLTETIAVPGLVCTETLGTRARRTMAAFVMGSVADALGMAEALVGADRPGLRVVCDFGPLQFHGGRPLTRDLHALRAADLVADAPPGCACATAAFAAEVRLAAPGQAVLSLTGRLGAAAPLPSVPLYRVHAGPSLRRAPERRRPPR